MMEELLSVSQQNLFPLCPTIACLSSTWQRPPNSWGERLKWMGGSAAAPGAMRWSPVTWGVKSAFTSGQGLRSVMPRSYSGNGVWAFFSGLSIIIIIYVFIYIYIYTLPGCWEFLVVFCCSHLVSKQRESYLHEMYGLGRTLAWSFLKRW